MKGAAPDGIEGLIRAACDGGRHDEAATLLIEHYGPAVLGFLVGWMGDREAAREAFSMFCEDLWSGLPRFEWRCTAQGWAYTLARNAGRRHAKAEQRKHDRLTSLSGRASELVDRIASSTEPYLKPDFKDRFEALRERLPADDRLLLFLRSGRQLAFRDIVFVLAEQDAEPDEAALVREAARLRKRFQTVKETLRDLARSEGLLE
jgi:RNA polymerase sigma-70 factor (ECF subfamily)